jgi:hypothetical protein
LHHAETFWGSGADPKGKVMRKHRILDNDEDRDCPADLPPWKARKIDRPPWKACNPHDRQQMIYWTILQLEKIENIDATTPRGQRKLARLVGERELRKLLARGAYRQQREQKRDVVDDSNDALNAAVYTVRQIRQIWQDEYGQKNRHADDGASAEEIAAYLFDVNVDHVKSRSQKPSGGKRRL